jgi:hypothetical protein
MELREAAIKATNLMIHHNLSDWSFGFDRAKKRLGQCDYRQKLITLSAPLVSLNNEDEITDTILHEIAHAIAGFSAGHGYLWKLKAIEIGAKPIRCYDRDKIIGVPGRWIGTCPICKRTVDFHRKPRRMRRSCGRCSPHRFNEMYLMQWSQNHAVS